MKNDTMTPAQAVAHIKAQTGDPARFRVRKRGYVDWKFGEVAEYLGYTAARAYAETMCRWYDYKEKYQDSLLDKTYQDFLTAEASAG
ncbi:MAG TPA: hypothetical protein PK228_15895 [Saprospiraceae bacterium]|nr:hypothetical protein [Saprospiraceae bacterium]